ncbi:Cell fate regulator YaaT, PSP1 superfamily (controls sporulation, competence, biofilm development) [Thermodesulfobium acidiphilum]|uniref:Cell fate regulator YaaT, PSP1 superfamily (Controls sporulation, competence, biofilm development) n=1 Tax=Thermodesulfobium acidiphilum TaxID=1794699 RepID=A0A2R4W061_THEAF|nr:regulatory iron-sulfur-containing complex subunit RicT [Thermodesulfobium acidiphilum]AWB10094.1 Cell fate regulator YaaT, PSP1 superfamily (controls sporulation, competence, biofilm development) [Thermodesulfobium acidiphilum]PMP85983.1 MAG: stage 0 sporulation family protein [Thermodesulfobium narugense]
MNYYYVKVLPLRRFGYFSSEEIFSKGDCVVVEGNFGIEMGIVDSIVEGAFENIEKVKRIIKLASKEDISGIQEREEKAKEILSLSKELARELKLEMKFLKAAYNTDGSKVTIYFTADGRIDFRELIKEITKRVKKTRVELFQVGSRDAVKLLGAIGSCGREVCCTTFLDEIDTISVKMVKDQGLQLNPTKISGVCGRLLCCMAYEYPFYASCKSRFPNIDDLIKTSRGIGRVIENRYLKDSFVVMYEDGLKEEISIDQWRNKKDNEKA